MNRPFAASYSSAVPASSAPGVPVFRVLVVPGDGIGREVIPAAVRVLEATGLPLAFVPAEAGWDCFERHGTSLPDATLAAGEADAVHGAAPDIAGRGIANPLAAIGCAAMLLGYLGRPPENREQRTKNKEQNTTADRRPPTARQQTSDVTRNTQHATRRMDNAQVWAGRIRAAVEATLASGMRTPDLGGTARTEDVTRAVIDAMTNLP